MERKLAFSTFLKLLELPEVEKAQTLRGFLRGGGFNYWRPLETLAPEIVRDGLELPGIQQKVAMMSKGHQRKYNENALINLRKWFNRHRVQHRRVPGKIDRSFGKAGLWVKLRPEVAFEMDRRVYLMHVWATNNPSLTDETLSMGLFFFRHHFRIEFNEDYHYLIFDSVKNRMFGEFEVLEDASDRLGAQANLLDHLWTELDVPAKGRSEPVISDVSGPSVPQHR